MNEEKVVCPMSLDRLIEKIAELKNPTVAGLDPKLSYIPDFIKQDAFRRYGETLEGRLRHCCNLTVG